MTRSAPKVSALGLALTLALVPCVAEAALPFQTRAVGHTFQCGPRTVDLPRDGSPTLAMGEDAPVATSKPPKWSTHEGTLKFGPRGATKIKLREYGSTVSLKADGQVTVCVRVR